MINIYMQTVIFNMMINNYEEIKKIDGKRRFFHDFLKSIKTYSKLSLKLGLAEFQSGLVLNLFFISDKNPGWVSYKRVSYKKKKV